ncbi:hypothetical protein [Psittacicella hinzii]|nr:hypothetical protein [Psittacicella hinzii]
MVHAWGAIVQEYGNAGIQECGSTVCSNAGVRAVNHKNKKTSALAEVTTT